MHKIRLLCGSIAVTIATHKNSKIQRLSEFFLMRIGACFATLAILSYTKIIDNNWYLRHLFSYFLLGIQWVFALASDKNIGHDFNLPLSCSVYAYSICHQGSAPGATGIQDGKAYDVGWDNTPVWIIAIGSK